MVDDTVKDKFKDRYSHIHPLIFNRSCFYAKSGGDLFDILEGIPKIYPIVWEESKRQWVTWADIRKSKSEAIN